MSDLLRPGDGRAGEVFSDAAVLAAMVTVEEAWLRALGAVGLAPPEAVRELASTVSPDDVTALAAAAEAGGNPVIPLVPLLRERLGDDPAARWVHRGLTSQDVLDTALMLCAQAALDAIHADLRRLVTTLRGLADRHRDTRLPGRTLTQAAVPITFGLKCANWLIGVLDAADDVTAARTALPVQAGGAAGTAAAAVELARIAGRADPVATAAAVVDEFAAGLGLAARPPWHTARRPVTRLGDALVAATDAFGRIANDVLVLGRLGELAEGDGGGSSTMPQKRNPVRSVLLRRAALEAPLLAAQLHLAAAQTVDERADGAWHLEWAPLRTLARSAVAAAGRTADLLAGLVVHGERMAADAADDERALLAERDSVHAAVDAPAASGGLGDYLGASGRFVDAALERGQRFLEETA